jgi:hypothetical protein
MKTVRLTAKRFLIACKLADRTPAQMFTALGIDAVEAATLTMEADAELDRLAEAMAVILACKGLGTLDELRNSELLLEEAIVHMGDHADVHTFGQRVDEAKNRREWRAMRRLPTIEEVERGEAERERMAFYSRGERVPPRRKG